MMGSQTSLVGEGADTVYDQNNKRDSDVVAAVNQFDYTANEVTCLSRKDGFANYDQATAAAPTFGKSGSLKLVDLRGKSYDDPMWGELLDQLTIGEMGNQTDT